MLSSSHPEVMPESIPIHLASGSTIRAQLLRNSGVDFTISPVSVDEGALKTSARKKGHTAVEIAVQLATAKALALRESGYVIGADQVLEFYGQLFSKPGDLQMARSQLKALRNAEHHLHSAVAVARDGRIVFSHVSSVTLHMRDFSDAYLEEYLVRNWPEIGASVGAYMLEEEGSRLFREIDGDYFTVLGLPLLPLLNFFVDEGILPG